MNPIGARPSVSVVVPVRDGAAALDRCLSALAAQDYPAHLVEVLVVDNRSVQDMAAVVARHQGVTLLRQPTGGSYAARNTGVERARGEVLAFTDADCEPAPGWLDASVAALAGPPRAAMVGGAVQLTYPRGAPVTATELYESLHAFDQQRYLTEQHFAITANMTTWRSTFDQVGPFDGTLMSRGDAQWGQRVASAGGEQRYSPDAVVRHPARSLLREHAAKWRRVAAGKVTVEMAGGASAAQLARAARWQVVGMAVAVRDSASAPQLTSRSARARYLVAVAVARSITGAAYAGGLARCLARPGTSRT